ncbi:MAG TPA: hypothetical protein VJ306_14030 [Pyrinomonadaceae bacterium]|jgi:hypothetical protein|nr:hypothetical protein [Pyrinomonadaceae bacterium]
MKLLPIVVILDVVGIIVLVIVVMRRKQQAHEIGPVREDRRLREMKPFFRRDVVDRKIASLFSEAEQSEVVGLLSSDLPITFGFERLQLALLKVSDGNLAELRRLVALITSDGGQRNAEYLQVIGQAEWPEAERMGDEYVKLLPEEQEPIFRRDLRQYLRWVKK